MSKKVWPSLALGAGLVVVLVIFSLATGCSSSSPTQPSLSVAGSGPNTVIVGTSDAVSGIRRRVDVAGGDAGECIDPYDSSCEDPVGGSGPPAGSIPTSLQLAAPNGDAVRIRCWAFPNPLRAVPDPLTCRVQEGSGRFVNANLGIASVNEMPLEPFRADSPTTMTMNLGLRLPVLDPEPTAQGFLLYGVMNANSWHQYTVMCRSELGGPSAGHEVRVEMIGSLEHVGRARATLTYCAPD